MSIPNINRLLENSVRSDVHGYNIYTMGRADLSVPPTQTGRKWDAPVPGLAGIFAIGHELDLKNPILPVISIGGVVQSFGVIRNHWTPAYMDTRYRSTPMGDYKYAGLLALREIKCFTADDTFLSQLTLYNDDREPMEVSLRLQLPFAPIGEGTYAVDAKIMPRCLGKKDPRLCGFVAATTDRGNIVTLTLPPHDHVTVRYGFAFSLVSGERALESLSAALTQETPHLDAEKRFNLWMDTHVPALYTDNTDLRKVYYYRYFVIKNAIHTPEAVFVDSDFKGECVYESPFGGWFGAPVGLPIPMQIEEMKWMRDTASLRSHIRNWCAGYGSTKGYVQFTPRAIWDYYRISGDRSILSSFYEACCTYTKRKCTADKGNLPITTGSWVTGAEYQPSFYQYTEPAWDWRCDTEGARQGYPITKLYRVDECVMHAANLGACAKMARELQKEEDAASFAEHAAAAAQSIRNLFWNEKAQFFFDVDVASGKQCDLAYNYGGFLPAAWEVMEDAYPSVFALLARGERFDGSFTTTTVDKECPMFWFDNCIAGPTASSKAEPHRYACSWNGPIWPYATTHVLESLVYAMQRTPTLRATFARLFEEYTELHFDYGDRSAPCICEHYRMSDGFCFSSFTEYFHSEWISLFMSGWAGISPKEDGIAFDPVTEDVFVLENVVVRGKRYRLSQTLVNGQLQRRTEVME